MKGLMSFGAMAFAAFLAACASTGGGKHMGEMLANSTGQNGRACIRQGDIRGYGVLKGDVISIDGSRSYYLATVMPGCTDLQTSVGALFSGGFGEICGGGMDRVVTGANHCTISKIYEFKNRDQALAAHKAALDQRAALDQSPMVD